MFQMAWDQKNKHQQVLAPISINATAATVTCVDTQAYDVRDGIKFVISFGSIGATVDALYLQESDVAASATSLTNPTQIPGSVVGTDAYTQDNPSVLAALPVASTDNGKIMVFYVNMQGRKRYIQPVVDPGAGATLVSITAEILGPAQSAYSSSTMGAALGWINIPNQNAP